MKKMLIFLLALVLVGCTPQAAPDTSTTTQPTSSSATQTTSSTATQPTSSATPVYVYENATENYLLPLDEYSWERQYPVEFVMLHFSSAVVNHRDDPYNMEYIRDTFVQYNVSTHYIIDREGNVECYIPENRAAWHAGKGTFLNDEKYTNKMNYYAIGIELAGMGSAEDMSLYLTEKEYNALDDSYKCFTDAQYESLRLLVADICRRNGIPMDRNHVIGHEDYSPTKNDPGQLFDWDRLLNT